MARLPTITATTALAGYAALQLLGRRAGSTREERNAALPGDDLVGNPQIVTNHATTIDAPPARTWPWLTQMGWHLGGYYTPHWVDQLLFRENWDSLDRLDPALIRDLKPGDIIPDGPPGTAFYVVVESDAPHVLVLRSWTHLPPGWGEKYDARFAWTWCFQLSELPEDRTRLHLRVRGHSDPWWFTALYVGGLVPADYVMATGMLRGLKRRVETGLDVGASGRSPYESVALSK